MQVEHWRRVHIALRSFDVFQQGLHLLSFLVQVLLRAFLENILDGFHFEESFVFEMLISDLLTAFREPFLGKALVTLVDQVVGVDREELADKRCVFRQEFRTFTVGIRFEHKF